MTRLTHFGSRVLDGRAALVHSSCSTNTWTAAMNAGVVRVSIIAMIVLATLGITSAQEAAKLPAGGPVLSNTGHDADAYGADEEPRRFGAPPSPRFTTASAASAGPSRIISADSRRPDCCSPGTTLFYTNIINTRDRTAIAFSPSRWRRQSPRC